MATIINLPEKQNESGNEHRLPQHIQQLLEQRKKAKREPLSPEKVRKTLGMENLTNSEVEEVVDTIKKLTIILFKIVCSKEATCIDNQELVSLNQQNKAA